MDKDIIYVENLSKTFKGTIEPVLNNINLTLKKGEMAALIGPDGAGKTTFLRVLCGLLVPDKGKILINSSFKGHENVKKSIGYMPQKFGLYEDLTVIENLKLFITLNGAKEKEGLIDTLLEFAGLIDFKKRLAGNLSGGMKQKLGLCCTLITKPEILLLDEPSVGVDPVSRLELMEIVRKLVAENGISVIWSTSYLDEAENFERVFLLSCGKKIYDGNPLDAAQKMQELVYLTGKDGVNLRALLRNILRVEENKGKPLADAVVEGNKIRVVFQNKKYADSFFLPKIQVKPRFEDFVIYTLKKENGNFSNKNVFTANIIQKLRHKNEENFFKYAIEANGLTKVYNTRGSEKFVAADNINFSIKKGEIFGLLGPNGAGKSTTFKMLCGLIRASKGYSSIMGVRMDENPSLARSYLGYMAQKFSLFGDLSVLQNLNFFAGVYGLSIEDSKRRILTLLENFDLKKYKDYDAKNLPLGYKQRLALSCAIVHNPPVLFLDEPTSGVDPLSRREFWNRINYLSENGTTVLITTHFMDEAQYCDRISLIFKGKTLIVDTPDNLRHLVKTDKNPEPTMQEAFIELILRERNSVK